MLHKRSVQANISQIGNLPQIGGENKTYLKPPTSIVRPSLCLQFLEDGIPLDGSVVIGSPGGI